METFDIPIVLLLSKNQEAAQTLRCIRQVRPRKLYILSSAGEGELPLADDCIDWECQVIQKDTPDPVGPWGSTALGIHWVFTQEEKAVFLEAGGLPESSFFYFCKEMLEKHENNHHVLWVRGENDPAHANGVSNASPCGWASWSKKFLRYYPCDMDKLKKRVHDMETYWWGRRVKYALLRRVRRVLRIPQDVTTKQFLRHLLHKGGEKHG